MPRFFIDYVPDDTAVITGGDAQHIAHALRMHKGEKLVLCDCLGMDYDGEIERIEPGGVSVLVRILSCCQSVSEPSLRVTLYQALPKQDKFDTVVQKAVELGVYRIVPMLSARCVSRPDERRLPKSASAGKNCRRSCQAERAGNSAANRRAGKIFRGHSGGHCRRRRQNPALL